MKINLGQYEIEIEVKMGEKDGTLYFLNDLSIAYHDSSRYNIEKGYKSLGERDKNFSDKLYEICDKAGLYEGLK